MKGIILAGGRGTRLYPATIGISKQLLPVYDKPMIYYPLSVLMLSGIQDILLISTPEDLPLYKRVLGDGSQFGINLSYKEQPSPDGLPQAFILGEEFIGDDSVCLILGDNILFGSGFNQVFDNIREHKSGGLVFGYHVADPERFGVVEFDKNRKVLSIEEKPKKAKSNYALIGLYFFDNRVVEIAKNVKPSARGETEIVDIMSAYLEKGELDVAVLGRGSVWFDSGTHASLQEAANAIAMVEKLQGLKIGCLEEISFNNGWISKDKLLELTVKYKNTNFADYLTKVANGEL